MVAFEESEFTHVFAPAEVTRPSARGWGVRYHSKVRFDHVKVLTRDVDALARFYEEALDCEPMTQVLDLFDDSLRRGLGLAAGGVRMIWLKLPGDASGPALELYQIEDGATEEWEYLPGQGHLSFLVDDVEVATEKVLASGGTLLGEMTDWVTPSGNTARFVYLRDPEGNIVDLWSRLSP